jgi:hypothetical protein
MKLLRQEIAEALEELEQRRAADFASRSDFEAFRLWLRDQQATQAAIASSGNVVAAPFQSRKPREGR